MKKKTQNPEDKKRKELDRIRREKIAQQESDLLRQEYKAQQNLTKNEIQKRLVEKDHFSPYIPPKSNNGEKEFLIQNIEVIPSPEHEIYYEKLEKEYFTTDGYNTEKKK